MKRLLIAVAAAALLVPALTAQQAGEWVSLFDGQTIAHWRGFKMTTVPDGWAVVDTGLGIARTFELWESIFTEKLAGQPLTRNWLPDFSTAGAVKTGEAEMTPVAVVLKKTKAAAVFRNIKVR